MYPVEVYRDDNGTVIYREDYKAVFMNNAQVRKYRVVCCNPKFDYKYIDDKIILVNCCGIPFQEYKNIGKNYLSSTGKERWKEWGPQEYGVSVDEYLEMNRWCEWFPQYGINANDVYNGPGTYGLRSIRDDFQMKKTFSAYGKDIHHPWYKSFYDYNYTAERYLEGSRCVPIIVHFEKKYKILELIEEMIASDKNIIDS